MTKTRLLIGTQKGAFFLDGDPSRRTWKLSMPMFLGHVIYHVVLDPRDRKTMVMAAKTGHLGPTVFRHPIAAVPGLKRNAFLRLRSPVSKKFRGES